MADGEEILIVVFFSGFDEFRFKAIYEPAAAVEQVREVGFLLGFVVEHLNIIEFSDLLKF